MVGMTWNLPSVRATQTDSKGDKPIGGGLQSWLRGEQASSEGFTLATGAAEKRRPAMTPRGSREGLSAQPCQTPGGERKPTPGMGPLEADRVWGAAPDYRRRGGMAIP